jgi:hypothetical protein
VVIDDSCSDNVSIYPGAICWNRGKILRHRIAK